MADDNELINQDEIEQLLQQAGSGGPPDSTVGDAPADADSSGEPVGQSEIEALLDKGSEAPPNDRQAAQASPAATADKPLKQDDIEALLNHANKAPSSPEETAAKQAPSASQASEEDSIAQGDVEYLLSQAEKALASIDGQSAADPPSGTIAFQLPELAGAAASTENATLDLISDVELDLKIELGRANMYLEDVLRLHKGSVVPLDKLAGDPVDIYANGRLIARGEVLVLNDNFCVRVAELIAGTSPAE